MLHTSGTRTEGVRPNLEVAGIPTEISSAADGVALAPLIKQLVPEAVRGGLPFVAGPMGRLLSALDFLREAQERDDAKGCEAAEGQARETYPAALAALREFTKAHPTAAPSLPSATPAPLAIAPQRRPRAAKVTKLASASTVAAPASAAVMPTPSDAVKTAVLKAAPQIFAMERVTSGMAAAVYEFVRAHKLFKVEQCDTMREYAGRSLGLKTKASQLAYARAGKAIWAHYPQSALKAVESLAHGFTQVNLMVTVPSVTVLRELPAALKRTDPNEHTALLERVEKGEVSCEELRQQGRERPTAPHEKEDDAPDGEAPPNGRRPDALNDAPDLRQAARALRDCLRVLEPVVRAWRQNPGPDVKPVLPELAEVLQSLQSNAMKLEELTPSAICNDCSGVGGRCKPCRGTGWTPRRPRAPVAHAPRHSKQVRKATTKALGRKKKKIATGRRCK